MLTVNQRNIRFYVAFTELMSSQRHELNKCRKTDEKTDFKKGILPFPQTHD